MDTFRHKASPAEHAEERQMANSTITTRSIIRDEAKRIMPENECEAVAEFIRIKGITRCPTACSSAVKASLFGIMSWRCLAQSEHGIARPRTGYALGTHWADFGNVEPNPNRTMPWSGRRLLSTRRLTRARACLLPSAAPWSSGP